MYEEVTYEELLRRKLARVSSALDKREGSIIYDALAPNAYESAILYTAIDLVLNETFADTASREYLIRRAAERGLSPRAATYATGVAEFNVEVPIGTRFSCGDYNWIVTESIGAGDHGVLKYYVRCETAGAGAHGSTASGYGL